MDCMKPAVRELKRKPDSFTLVEMVVVIAIAAVLSSLVFPSFAIIQNKGRTIKCLNNLRSLGHSVNLYATDHDGNLPTMEPLTNNPVNPNSPKSSLAVTLQPYGATDDVLKCPADAARGANARYKAEGASYEWNYGLNDDKMSNPKYIRWTLRNTLTWIICDYDSIHPDKGGSTKNVVYLDGHAGTLP